MADSTMVSTDPKLAPKARTYVVYDTKSGKVLHVHHMVTFTHTHKLPETPEALALRMAGKRAKAGAAVLETDVGEISGGYQLKVDVKRGVVVPIRADSQRSSKKRRR